MLFVHHGCKELWLLQICFLDQVFTKRYDRVKYKGEWKDCDNFHTLDDSGNGCNCPFVACTGSQPCSDLSGFFCRFLHSNVDVNDVTREDCACKWL